ncbi:MAG: aminotransferase class IV [Deltaproteobacteria bacterium]|nr:aminotransferase class IV [Deltaproteobacteria bacterium]
MKAYLNGKIIPENKACVSIFDRGLLYGDGLLDTMRAEDGAVLFLPEHLKRLKKGAKALGIPIKAFKAFDEDIKAGVIEKLLKANGLNKGAAYIRITVTRGVDKSGYMPQKDPVPTFIIACKPVDLEHVLKLQKNGVKAVIIKGYGPPIPSIKTLNYLPSVLGKAEAIKKGAYEGIFTDNDTSVREGTASNIFIVKNGKLMTPMLKERLSSEGILPGIMRGVILWLAKKNKLDAEETKLYVEDLLMCEEAFLTNSISEIVPVTKINGSVIGTGKRGPITRLLQDALKDFKQ